MRDQQQSAVSGKAAVFPSGVPLGSTLVRRSNRFLAGTLGGGRVLSRLPQVQRCCVPDLLPLHRLVALSSVLDHVWTTR